MKKSAGLFRHWVARQKLTFLYGVVLAGLLLLLKWLEWRFMVIHHAFEVYAGGIAVVFTALGIWLAMKLGKPTTRTVVVEKPVYGQPGVPFESNQTEVARLGLSKRELEVLQLMAEGLSNQEIALRLFVSLNTVKTHATNLFEKMEVRRRTQAIEKARRLSIIP